MEMIRKYQVLLNTRPVLTRALTGFGISFLSDFLSQYIECKIEGFDFKKKYVLMRSINLAVYNCVVKARVEGHYINTLKMNLLVWPAAMLVNFKYIPLQYQVLYANLVGFVWTIYLSWAIHKHKIVYDEII